MKKTNFLSLILLGTVILLASFFSIKDPTLYVDETVHYKVIENFCNLNFTIHPNLTNIPAYHAILGGICYLGSFILPLNSIHFTRITSLFLSLLGLIFFYLLAKKIQHKTPLFTVLQLFLLPIAFPFYFLIYTDIPAIAPIALALLFTLNHKYAWAGILVTLSIAFRQNNFVWLGWLALTIFFDGMLFKSNLKYLIQYLLQYLSKVSTFILGAIAFVGFVKWNGGISLAKAEEWAHPSFSFHLGNVYLMLVLFTLAFLPIVIATIPKIKRIWNHKLILSLFLLTCGLITYTFLFQFNNTHPYNQHEFAVHNKILVLMTQSFASRLVSLIPMLLALLTIFSTKFRRPLYYLMYPFALLFVLPSWLIEPRYYIIPFYFYLLFKEESSNLTKLSLIIWELIGSSLLLYGTLNKLLLP